MALKQLVEKREELAAKNKRLLEIKKEAQPDPAGNDQEMDLSLIKSIKGTDDEKLSVIRKLKEETDALGKQVDELAKLEEAMKDLSEEHEVKGGKDTREVGRFATKDAGEKTFGDLFIESREFKSWQRGSKKISFRLDESAFPMLKTTFTTSAGYAPESTRIGRFIDYAVRPIQVIDTIPAGETSQATILYMKETTATSAAAERNEEAAYAASTFAWTETSSTVRSIGHSLPVTDEQLEDAPQVRSILNQRMAFFVRQRLDLECLVGDGSAPNLRGFNNLASIQTQAKGADPVPDAIYKAMTAIRVTGRAQPSVVYLHPNDWQTVRLLRTTDGIYIWGNPSEAGPMRIWGVLVVETDAQTENTGLVGDVANFAQLFMRRDVMVEIGYVNDDFTDGRVTLRAGLRAALVAYRDEAFCTVTGI